MLTKASGLVETYLVASADAELVEDRQVDLGRGEHDYGVGGHQGDVLGPILIYFSRSAEQRDGRHKAKTFCRSAVEIHLDAMCYGF